MGRSIHATPEGRDRLGGANSLARLGAERIAEDALATGRAAGELPLGHLTIARLGTDATTVLAATFGAAHSTARAEQPQAPAVAPAPPPGMAAPTNADTAPAPAAAPAGPAPLRIDLPIPERHHPLRFVWQMDANEHFTLGSDEFTEVIGPRIATAMGRPWKEITDTLALDPEGQVARAVATRDTWSGITVSWPVDGSADRLKVELSGLPIYDRNRNFLGYRGFGVCRDIDRIATLAGMRRLPAQPTAAGVVPPADSPPAAGGPAASPGERPALTLVPSAPNVVPFRGNAPEPKSPALSPVERSAFHELARQLTARLKGETQEKPADGQAAHGDPEAPTTAAQPANNENAPPAGPVETAGAQPAMTAIDERRKAAEIALALAEAQTRELKAILDTATDGVVVIEADGRIVSAQPQRRGAVRPRRRRTRWPTTSPTCSRPRAGRPRSTIWRASRAADAGSRSNDGREVTGRVRQGGAIALFMTLGRIADDSRRVCAVFRDVTPWKKAESDLVAARQRGREGVRRQVRFPRQDQPRDPHAAQFHHRLLRGDDGGALRPDRQRALPRLSQGHPRLRRRTWSRCSTTCSTCPRSRPASSISPSRAVDLNEVVQGCVALMQPQANRERIIIRTSLVAQPAGRSSPTPARCARSCSTCLSNSIKFTGAGGQVIVSTAQTGAGDVVLRVRDTGIGMRRRRSSRSRSSRSGSSRPPARWGSAGTGLGLPLTKALAEANRGDASRSPASSTTARWSRSRSRPAAGGMFRGTQWRASWSAV